MADTQRTKTPSRVVVIGLGRFGISLARELARRGYEILGIDSDPRRVQVLADDLTHTVVADTTDEEALRQLRVAHLVTGRMLDFIQFEDDYAIIKTIAPSEAVGLPLGDSRLRSKYDVTVVGIKRPGEGFTYATAETVVHRGDVLIVAGKTAAVERVADLD